MRAEIRINCFNKMHINLPDTHHSNGPLDFSNVCEAVPPFGTDSEILYEQYRQILHGIVVGGG